MIVNDVARYFGLTPINAILDIFLKRIDSRIITSFAKAQGFHYVTSTLYTSRSTSDIGNCHVVIEDW